MNDQPLIAFEDKTDCPIHKGGIQVHSSKEYNLSLIEQYLVGKIIKVYWSQAGHQLNDDKAWITSICIKGKLEHKGKVFRVLVENDTYTYFGYEDILTVAVRDKAVKKPHSISLISKKNT